MGSMLALYPSLMDYSLHIQYTPLNDPNKSAKFDIDEEMPQFLKMSTDICVGFREKPNSLLKHYILDGRNKQE